MFVAVKLPKRAMVLNVKVSPLFTFILAERCHVFPNRVMAQDSVAENRDQMNQRIIAIIQILPIPLGIYPLAW